MKKFFLFVLNFVALFANAQINKDSLKALGQKTLITLAEKAIQKTHPEFRASSYDWITVKESDNDLGVEFSYSLRLVPHGSNRYYDVWYTFSGKMTLTNDNNFPLRSYPKKIFIHNRKSRKTIRFIINSINHSEDVGHIKDGKLPYGTDMLIYEKFTHYDIEVISRSTHSRYKIGKATGKIYRQTHKHFAQSKIETEPKSEFKAVRWE